MMRWYGKALAMVVAAASSLAVDSGSASPVDLSAPSGELGAANARGFLEFWREVDGVGIELGKGSYLPLRYRFSTESDRAGALGAGFFVPMFETKNVLIREDTMLANLPCGKKLYLWRDPADASKFQTPDREWKGSLNDDDFTLWRDDGWKVIYRGGRLISTISDDKRTTFWSYDAAGGGSVEQDGKTVVAMEPGVGGQTAGFVFGSKSYKTEYGKRPIMEEAAGQMVLKEVVPALTKLTLPDGRVQTFEFSLTDEHLPKLITEDAARTSIDYTWDAATQHISTEKRGNNTWTYKIKDVAANSSLPVLTRIDSQGNAEGSQIDEKSGTYTRQTKNGVKVITHLFETPGPLYHKVKLVEHVSDGVTKLIIKFSYDESGRLIRSINKNGFITTYQYDNAGHCVGRQIKLTTDKAFLDSLAEKEKRLVANLDLVPAGTEKDKVLNDLFIFYIGQELNYDKAEQLLPVMTNHEQIYNLKLALAENPKYDKLKRRELLVQLIQEFPDKKQYTERFLQN